MIHLLVGHRGVGKTTLLKRVLHYHKHYSPQKNIFTYDLDHEIGVAENRPVSDIFAQHGEGYFRQCEQRVVRKLLKQHSATVDVWLSLGAGFEKLSELKEEIQKNSRVKIIWVRRETDAHWRIFLDRPRLNIQLNPLEEFRSRYQQRDPLFQQAADQQMILREGDEEPSTNEAAVLGFTSGRLGGVITLLPANLTSMEKLFAALDRWQNLKVQAIELRDDLLNKTQLLDLAQKISIKNLNPQNFIYSLRQQTLVPPAWRGARVDWALELGVPENFEPEIISCHQRRDSLKATFADLPTSVAITKLAVPVHSLFELREGHEWWLKDPKRRAFLPMSANGRWQWYRQVYGPLMPLAFWREGDGSAIDQPTALQWAASLSSAPQEKHRNFAAVLGTPVRHSRTPVEQEHFWQHHNLPVVSLELAETELNKENLIFLKRLGLKAAAVTAPLKAKMFALAKESALESQNQGGFLPTAPVTISAAAEQLASVNTIYFSENSKWDLNGFHSHNTDLDGLKSEQQWLQGTVAIWGGGGTRSMLEACLPQAHFFSARTSNETSDKVWQEQAPFLPEVVVWAVGRSRMSACQFPPSHWRPTLIYDLNYAEDSPGREYALKCGAKYRSGLAFFKAQAEGQRTYWSKCLDEN